MSTHWRCKCTALNLLSSKDCGNCSRKREESDSQYKFSYTQCLIYPPGGEIDIAPILNQLRGCLDGHCDVRGKASGMHTNGGCKCLHWLNVFERHAAREYLMNKRLEATT